MGILHNFSPAAFEAAASSSAIESNGVNRPAQKRNRSTVGLWTRLFPDPKPDLMATPGNQVAQNRPERTVSAWPAEARGFQTWTFASTKCLIIQDAPACEKQGRGGLPFAAPYESVVIHSLMCQLSSTCQVLPSCTSLSTRQPTTQIASGLIREVTPQQLSSWYKEPGTFSAAQPTSNVAPKSNNACASEGCQVDDCVRLQLGRIHQSVREREAALGVGIVDLHGASG